MAFKNLLVETKDAVLTVTLNRPEVRNAFNDELIGELTQVFSNEATQKDIHLVRIKGNGKSFSAGGDLNWMKKSATYSREENIADAGKLSTLLQTMNELEKPLIGQVHGAALGGGMGLVAVCDIVVASEETQLGFSEVRLGLIPAVIGPFVIAKIGESQARSLFLSGDRLLAQRAYEIGLVHQISAPGDALEQATNHVLATLKASSPHALQTAKKFIHAIKNKPTETQHQIAAETLATIRASDQGKEGITAFLEKRKPNWS